MTRQNDGSSLVPDGATSFTINSLDFNRLSLRSNVVIRWEWAPGSTFYLIWQQNRAESIDTGQPVGFDSLGDAITAPGDNFLALKVSYWIGLR